MTSPAGATTGGSQPGSEKVYTEAELQQRVGAAQSSLQQQLNVAREARKAAEQRAAQADELEAELAEYKDVAKVAPDKVSDVRKRRELEAREAALTARELGLERTAVAAELGLDATVLAEASTAELRALRIVFMATKAAPVKTEEKPPQGLRAPSRIPGSTTTPSFDGLLEKDTSKMDYLEVQQYTKEFLAARRDVKLGE